MQPSDVRVAQLETEELIQEASALVKGEPELVGVYLHGLPPSAEARHLQRRLGALCRSPYTLVRAVVQQSSRRRVDGIARQLVVIVERRARAKRCVERELSGAWISPSSSTSTGTISLSRSPPGLAAAQRCAANLGIDRAQRLDGVRPEPGWIALVGI
jgi:hypothetical protein